MAGPDTNTDAAPYPVWGFSPPAPEPETKNLDALLASLNGSAERFQTLWFSFLGLTLYLAITALATTHRMLLLGEPQTLPILNIKVELLPFYVIAPLLYLVFHFYLLMMLVLLARTAAEFGDQLRTTLPDETERERYRARVDNSLFLQLLIGMKPERVGLNGWLLATIALITIALAPVATLLLMQMMFLPYHSLPITWWHRLIVVTDLALILVLWRRYFGPRAIDLRSSAPSKYERRRRSVRQFAQFALVAFAFWLTFWEGRWAGEEPNLAKWRFLWEWQTTGNFAPEPFNPASTADGVVFGLFPDRLKLPSETIVGEEKLEKTKKEIASRNGDFVPTISFDGRDLQAADLSGADLRGVSLRGAAFQGAKLDSARLDGARLDDARLQGADLSLAQLQGADLSRAELWGADLSSSQLPGARLESTELQGANLSSARLQGANLTRAELFGAQLSGAQLQGASVRDAQLQGADLSYAQLQGADLSYAQLQGANLGSAQLQGADLSGANWSETELQETFVFGTYIEDRHSLFDPGLSTIAIRSVLSDKVKLGKKGEAELLSPSDVDAWAAAATPWLAGWDKGSVAERFDRLKAALTSDFRGGPPQVPWSGMEEASLALDPEAAHHRQRLAALFVDLACKPYYGAPYIARRLVADRLEALGGELDGVRKRMKDGRGKPEVCWGVIGFTDEDWGKLDALKFANPEPGDR
jgi:uncharacterized protein YjbI with pentapeptide repeats